MQHRHSVRIVAACAAAALSVSGLAACGSAGSGNADAGEVYYLNSKPEIVDQVKELGEAYSKESGVKVNVETATSDNYDSTLASELSKSGAPTMFNVSSYPTFVKVRDYLAPVQNTEPYKLLNAEGKAAAMQQGNKAYSLPFVSEYFGIIYNRKIVKNYCSKSYAVIKSDKDIKDYATLKKVVESIQKHKTDLGLDAAWATPGMDSAAAWRVGDHAIRVMIAGEYRDNNARFVPDIQAKYIDQYKSFIDLQKDDNPTQASQISSKTIDDVMSEFTLGQVAFVNNGTWANTQLDGGKVSNADIGVLPYYMGIPDETDYGVAASHEMQWGINAKSPKKDRKATLDFIKWCVSSDKGKEIMSKEMGFSVPYTTFGKKDQPTDNPIMTAAKATSENGKKKYLATPMIPSSKWSSDVNNAVGEYLQGTGSWDKVKSTITGSWKSEWQIVKTQTGSLPENGLE